MGRAMVSFLSVVVPAYNERGRVRKIPEEMRNYLERRGFNYKIIVLEDEGQDETSALVQEMRKAIPQATRCPA